jgi:hypothetical protein
VGKEPTESNEKQKKVVISRKELLSWTSLSVVVLAALNLYIFSSFSVPVLTIKAGDAQTFSIFDGAFTFVINNNWNTNDKILKIYGFSGPVSLDISASEFIGDMSSDAASLLLDGDPRTHIENKIYTQV